MEFLEHNRRSIRLKDYDYSENGYYYVTICTKNREEYFGKIINRKMHYSQIGEIVCKEWIRTEQIRENIKMDKFVVMPDHLHGIVIIENGIHVGAYCNTPLQTNKFRSPSNNLGAIIMGFKSSVKRWCNKNNFKHFQWQRNYYEHVIRDEKDLYEKRNYIINNPLKWKMNTNNMKTTCFLL